MKVGDLVKSNTGTKHHGVPGIIVDTRYRFNDPRNEEMIMVVLYPDGTEAAWAEVSLEVISESR